MLRVPITIEGEIALKDELSKLKFIERPKISEAIAEARAHGDLKENAEYHAAKELQGLMEAKINEIEQTDRPTETETDNYTQRRKLTNKDRHRRNQTTAETIAYTMSEADTYRYT